MEAIQQPEASLRRSTVYADVVHNRPTLRSSGQLIESGVWSINRIRCLAHAFLMAFLYFLGKEMHVQLKKKNIQSSKIRSNSFVHVAVFQCLHVPGIQYVFHIGFLYCAMMISS